MRNAARLLLLSLVFLSGCASTTAPQHEAIVYPPPPEEPKIAYVRLFRGEGDFRERRFFDAIFGAPRSRGLFKPYGVFARGDDVYITLTGSASVAIINARERTVRYLGAGGMGSLSLPIGVAGAADGVIFVSDAKEKRVYGYDPAGRLAVAIGKKGEFANPAGLAVNQELGRLYVVDSLAHAVLVYTLKGELLFQFGGAGTVDGRFNYPSNAAVDRRNGNVYITDTQNFRIQVFDQDGKFIRKFGEIGTQPGNFTRPRGIGVDSEGHVYVTDAGFENIQIFDEEGRLLLFFGGGGFAPGYFQLPAGLYVDEQDRIFIVDSLNHRVQVFQYLSESWKKKNPEEYKKYLLEPQETKKP